MVKFDRSQVCDILEPGDAVEITVEGAGEGFRFVGADTIRVISEGKRNRHQNAESDLSIFASTATYPHTGTLYFYHLDHLGTPQVMTDENGEVVWKADYQPFGTVDVTVSDVENTFRFPGQYYNNETELHYNYHRLYDPKTGRYLTPDPIGLEGGINLYAYAGLNPINLLDPLGLYTFRQGLQDTAKYAWVFGAGSAFAPGGQPAAITFAGIVVAATALEVGLYSENPFWEGIRESVKMLIPIKNPFVDKAKDQAIDKAYDIFKQKRSDKSTTECP